MKKVILFCIVFLSLAFLTECSDNETQSAAEKSSDKPMSGKCGDGTCDQAEQADPLLCPADCSDNDSSVGSVDEQEDESDDEVDENLSPGTVLLFFIVQDTEKLIEERDKYTVNGVLTRLPSNTVQSAVSTDGYHFTRHTEKWITHEDLADPVVWVGEDSVWMLASGTLNGSVRFTYATQCPTFSNDSFTALEGIRGAIPDIFSVPGGYRLYYVGDGGIRSMFSADGKSFTEEEGVRLAVEMNVTANAADPAVTKRSDGTYVMYFKSASKTAASDSPYYHNIYRATSEDGITFVEEDMERPLIEHASIPAVYTDQEGRVWIYYLNFAAGWPEKHETIWATYEQEDYTLAEPKEVTFTPTLSQTEFANDPDPLLLPETVDFSACIANS